MVVTLLIIIIIILLIGANNFIDLSKFLLWLVIALGLLFILILAYGQKFLLFLLGIGVIVVLKIMYEKSK